MKFAHEHIIIGNRGTRSQSVHYTDDEVRFDTREEAQASAARLSTMVGFRVDVYRAA